MFTIKRGVKLICYKKESSSLIESYSINPLHALREIIWMMYLNKDHNLRHATMLPFLSKTSSQAAMETFPFDVCLHSCKVIFYLCKNVSTGREVVWSAWPGKYLSS